ncbi:MAG TPA: hypothetical protein VFN10_20515 [Thermoanaerobaculia bacterium]|nr:hypothetical protein [Thermoanaerobaculia bacterium]
MKRYSWIAGFALALLSSCATTGVQRYTPSFDYTPSKEVKPAAANITFGVVNASYPEPIPLFQQFGQNMSQDFFEILTARGYTVRGPFRTYDDITFPDKKGSDLILMPELQIRGDASRIKWEQGFGAALLGAMVGSNAGYSAKGDIVFSGRVNLVLAESLSREKMWTKSIDIPPLTVHIEETKLYPQPGVPLHDLLENEDVLYNDVAKALEAQYKTILDRSYQYLDPEEISIVKKQSQEIRNKKVY